MQYHANIEERRTQRREEYSRRSTPATPSAALESFRASVESGPIFGCCICHQHHYKSGVVRLEQVRRHLEEHNLQHLVNLYYTDHLLAHQLYQLGTLWCCKGCRDKVAMGATPTPATANGLAPTWLHQPELSQEEHQAVTQYHPLLTISGLKGSTRSREAVIVVPTFPPAEVAERCITLESFLDLVHSDPRPYVLRFQVPLSLHFI